MKTLKLALLGSMIAAANMSAFALESLTDEALSTATGQDGLTVIVDGTVNADYIYIHDNDGYMDLATPDTPTLAATALTGTAAQKQGAITLGENGTAFSIVKGTGNTGALATITIDADGNGNNAAATAVLNVNIATGALDITTGEIGVARSKRGAAATDFTTANTGLNGGYAKILDSMTIKLGAMNTNIQLGSAPQGSMIKVTGSITGGFGITNLAVYDAASCATCGVKTDKLFVANAWAATEAASALSLDGTAVSITAAGLAISTPTNPFNIGLSNVKLGDVNTVASIGDIEIGGLGGGTTVTIAGH